MSAYDFLISSSFLSLRLEEHRSVCEVANVFLKKRKNKEVAFIVSKFQTSILVRQVPHKLYTGNESHNSIYETACKVYSQPRDSNFRHIP